MSNYKIISATAGLLLALSASAFAQTTVTPVQENRDPAAEGGAVAGAATGAVAGAVVGGPIGAAVGGIAGAAVGAVTGDIANPTPQVREYVVTNRVQPVVTQDPVAVGTVIPAEVALQPIPDYQYQYIYVNEQPVLVDPSNRQVVYIVQ